MAQGLEPGAFKLWVNWIQPVQPHHGRSRRQCTGNSSPSLVRTVTSSAAAAALRSAA
jgi:hypothetical protein